MLTPAQAEKLILEAMPLWHREDCPLVEAQGRVLRAELKADRDLPPFDRVTLDGFALRAAEVAAGRREFRVIAVQAAGMRPIELGASPGSCVEIMTGAALPADADSVVPYEDAVREGEWIRLPAEAAVEPGQAVHRRGADHRAGGIVVPAGVRLSGREIAVAAACGYSALTVSRLPKIAVVATGDELVDLGAAVGPHQIRRSNDYALRAALALVGNPRVDRFHLRDMRQEIEHLLWHILAEYDVVLLSGGVSKGKFDFLPEELDRQGVRKVFQGVAQRPGKPFWFGLTPRRVPVFALPGNPVSAMTCLRRYVLPALEKAAGLAPSRPVPAALAVTVAFRPKLARLLPVRLVAGPGADRRVEPGDVGTSGDFAGLVGTDGFVELDADRDEFPQGAIVPFWSW